MGLLHDQFVRWAQGRFSGRENRNYTGRYIFFDLLLLLVNAVSIFKIVYWLGARNVLLWS